MKIEVQKQKEPSDEFGVAYMHCDNLYIPIREGDDCFAIYTTARAVAVLPNPAQIFAKRRVRIKTIIVEEI